MAKSNGKKDSVSVKKFDSLKETDKVRTRDGHIAHSFSILTEHGVTFIRGKLTPKEGSIYTKFNVGTLEWELSGCMRGSAMVGVSGLELSEII